MPRVKQPHKSQFIQSQTVVEATNPPTHTSQYMYLTEFPSSTTHSNDIVQRGRRWHAVQGAAATGALLGHRDGPGALRRGPGRDRVRRDTALFVQERFPAGEGELPQLGVRRDYPVCRGVQTDGRRLRCRVSISVQYSTVQNW